MCKRGSYKVHGHRMTQPHYAAWFRLSNFSPQGKVVHALPVLVSLEGGVSTSLAGQAFMPFVIPTSKLQQSLSQQWHSRALGRMSRKQACVYSRAAVYGLSPAAKQACHSATYCAAAASTAGSGTSCVRAHDSTSLCLSSGDEGTRTPALASLLSPLSPFFCGLSDCPSLPRMLHVKHNR